MPDGLYEHDALACADRQVTLLRRLMADDLLAGDLAGLAAKPDGGP